MKCDDDRPARWSATRAQTRDESAWQYHRYSTVQLVGPFEGLRVHTGGRAFPGRQASDESGAWILIGDVIQTAPVLASSRALPVDDARRLVAFTHTSEAYLGVATVLNIGLASRKFGGTGGEFQAEYVSGPPIRFVPLVGKHWHGTGGRA
jgi:hypothetical protein